MTLSATMERSSTEATGHLGIVVVIDDDRDVLEAYRSFLEETGWLVLPFASASSYLQAAESGLRAACVICDVVLPGISGIELLKELQKRRRPEAVIMISGKSTIDTAVRALHAGAKTFIEKPVDPGRLLAALKECTASPAPALSEDSLRDVIKTLPTRLKQVVSLACRGLSNKQIARELGISSRTVETYRASAMARLQTPKIAQLVSLYLANKDEFDRAD